MPYFRLALTLLSLLLASGCASLPGLMPTPHIYIGEQGYPQLRVPVELRSNKIDLLYVTDRLALTDITKPLKYGSKRSDSMVVGSVIVEIGNDLSWKELVDLSQLAKRKREPPLRVLGINEIVRFPATPYPFSVVDGQIIDDPEVTQQAGRAKDVFHKELRRRLAVANSKEVMIFVHGFNNSFDWAATSQAELWHFSGRTGVPILYSWPAASGGLFGYFVDRESGEFTIFHLKEFIRLVASLPEVEKINVIAHSRGTDITTTALRELVIEARGSGQNPLTTLKIQNLILAAPDLDLDIVRQRLMAEKFGPAFGQITIYTNSTDKALNLSETLMSGTRFGRMEASDLKKSDEDIFSQITNVHIVDVGAIQGRSSHSYFLNHPATSSDIILVLTKGLKPGDPGRPLIHKFLNYWEMPRDYLK